MKILVTVKQVPDTTGKVAVNPDGTLNRASMQATTNLSALTVGTVPLVPAFTSGVTEYAATTTNAADAITAAAEDANASIVIKNGDTTVSNGSDAEWTAGENTVTITVTSGNLSKVYTVVVTYDNT